jgi:hypothetical protein
VGGVQNSTLYDGIIGSIEAFNLLSSQPNVDDQKMAVTGSSWGGYLTTFTAGLLGSRVKAAYSTWGCGFYETGSFWSESISQMPSHYKSDWLTYLDAGRRAKDITAPYFIEQATNDTYFWPEAVSATLNAITGTKNHVTMANLNHDILSSSAAMKQRYMNYHLKGVGSIFGTINITSSDMQLDGSLKINMNVSLPVGVSLSSVQLYYSVPTLTWQTRNWIELQATLVNGSSYQATLPASLVNKGVNYYANMIDTRQFQTSSALYKTSTSLNTESNILLSGVSVFPNPLQQDKLTIKVDGENIFEIFKVTISNLQGQIVYQTNISGKNFIELNTDGWLKSAVYLVSVQSGQKISTTKLIVQ